MIKTLQTFFKIWSPQTFSIKGQGVSVFSFEGRMVSIVTSQLCCCIAKADRQYAKKWAWLSDYEKNFFYW